MTTISSATAEKMGTRRHREYSLGFQCRNDFSGSHVYSAFRNLEDEDLDSGDDEGRTDRVQREDEHKDEQLENLEVMDAELERHAVPEPSDGEVHTKPPICARTN
jgi:hypothetical protein